jgi:FAD synthetase
MSLEELTSKYIASAEKVLENLRLIKGSTSVTEESINNILGYIRAYLEDAKYYKSQKKLEISLTSIAYCEGLLDALRLMGIVMFEWPTNTERKKSF